MNCDWPAIKRRQTRRHKDAVFDKGILGLLIHFQRSNEDDFINALSVLCS